MASIINALSSGAGGLVTSGDTSGVLQLQNNSSASVTLDASGNVGIGTTTPAGNLGVAGTLFLGNQASSGSTGTGKLISTAGALYVQSGLNTTNGSVAPIIFTDMGNSVERMRIDSNGSVNIGSGGVGSDTGYLTLIGSTGQGYGPRLIGKRSGVNQWQVGSQSVIVNNTSDSLMCITGNSGGVVLSSGATSWSAYSDERMKDIIEPIENAAEKVSKLRAVIGKYKTDEEGTRRAFLIAQDVEDVLPEAVDKEDENQWALRYTETIPLLVAAIKEQQTIINDLKARVTALEGAAL